MKSAPKKWKKTFEDLKKKRQKRKADNKKKQDAKDKKNKNSGSQSERFVVEKAKLKNKLVLVVYVKEKPTGKSKRGKKGGNKEKRTLLVEGGLKKIDNQRYLYNIKMKKGTGYAESKVLSKFFLELKSRQAAGFYIARKAAAAKTDKKGKAAFDNGFNTLTEVSGGTIFINKAKVYIVKSGTNTRQEWKVFASKQEHQDKKSPLVEAVYVTIKSEKDKQALKIKLVNAPSDTDTKTKKKWLNALFKAVVNNQASEDTKASKKREVSVIVAEPKTGFDMSKFKKLKNDDKAAQAKINEAGQQTLVGGWAQNILLGAVNYEYKFTLVQNSNLRFAKTACFVAGTKVWLHNRQVNIEDVHPYDTVRAFDTNTQQEVLGVVTHSMIKQASTLIGVYTVTDTLWVTPEHPFYINGQWVPAGRLKKGQRLTLLHHPSLLASKTQHLPRSNEVYIERVVTKDTLVTVYNFTVAQYHNYYVGNVGVLVHNNDDCRPIIKIHPDYIGLDQDKIAPYLHKIINKNIIVYSPYTSKPIQTGFLNFVVKGGKLIIGRGHYNLAGKANEIDAAGLLYIKNGKLFKVSNASGHYIVSVDFAKNHFKEIFEELGVSFSNIKIEALKDNYYAAREFLTNKEERQPKDPPFKYQIEEGKLILQEIDPIFQEPFEFSAMAFVVTMSGDLRMGRGHYNLSNEAKNVMLAGMFIYDLYKDTDLERYKVSNDSGHYLGIRK